MSAGGLVSPATARARSPKTSPASSTGTLGSPPASSGGQRAHYGPLWFVQVPANNSSGHAAAPAARRALAVRGPRASGGVLAGAGAAKTNNNVDHKAPQTAPGTGAGGTPSTRSERRTTSTSSSSSGNARKHLRVRVDAGAGSSQVSSLSSLRPKGSRAAPAAHRDSFHGAMCPALMVAQCFALLPVDGISRTHPGVPQFRWLSFRVFYTIAVFLGTGVVALLAAYRMMSSGLSFNSSVTVVFFGNSLSAMVLFLQLATRWPAVARAWARIEHDMRTYGYPRHLGRKVKIMTAVVLLLATVEHLLAVMTAVYTSWPCYKSGGIPGLVRGYSINNFAMVLQVTEYAPWKAAFVFLLNLVATFSWNYTDLFIMLLSVSLAQRFKQLNHRLRALKGKNLPSGVWRQLRETYNSLACLTRTVDEAVNNIVLLSFASNLYFICVQLLQGMKLILDVYPYVYFFFSFGYLLLRTCVVSLYAASIHDESKEPRRVLYSVPSESFCTEVRRFLAQVTTDDVALTGCNFFSVTRSLMLTVGAPSPAAHPALGQRVVSVMMKRSSMQVAGTIVTYEIVLVQFQGVSGDGTSDLSVKPANLTVRCF
ncbi:Gustatory receptor for sugar taste 64f [Frankliniella fusca]|uniref:Gustatory receptor for sugar taste 64f n=1 Tax=Frankliniella fusca TaxID=407009 RepID=A0AAE1H0N5_9NEOP|nr:Gustatory receptor for sugar taste 64f [Frankliniella fusca]